MTKLSKHFYLIEWERSNIAGKLGIDNSAPAWAIPNMRFMSVEVLDPIREEFGAFTIGPNNSGWRCPELNDAVDGVENSFHQFGLGVDIEVAGVSNEVLGRWAYEHLPTFDKVILENHIPGLPSSGWVHIQAYPLNTRKFIRL